MNKDSRQASLFGDAVSSGRFRLRLRSMTISDQFAGWRP